MVIINRSVSAALTLGLFWRRFMHAVSRTNRWLGLALLLAWSLSHATVFGDDQPGKDPAPKKSPPSGVDVLSDEKAEKISKILERSMASSAEKVKAALDQSMVLDFTAQTLQEGLQHLSDKAK